MKKLIYFVMLLLVTTLASSPLVLAEDQDRDQDQLQQRVFGWDLMTSEERMQHRETMRNMKTEEEREAYRQEHHQRMQERAKERGVELPPYQPGRGYGAGGRWNK